MPLGITNHFDRIMNFDTIFNDNLFNDNLLLTDTSMPMSSKTNSKSVSI